MSNGTKTEKLYYTYASSMPFKAEILELKSEGKETAIILDKTIFYPEGGGQPADMGTINGVSILNVIEKNGEILHMVSAADAKTLKADGHADLILDVRRRRELSALHTGQHLLSATLLRMINAPTVSMHMGDDHCTIDVDTAEISDETLLAVEEAVADAIEENHPVIIHPCPPGDPASFPLRKIPPQGEDVIRIVEIEGHDFIACCGTHLKSTGEIGLFRITGTEKYKGMNRVSFLSGRRLLDDCRLLRKNAVIVSRAISVPVNEIGKGVLDYVEKAGQMEKQLKQLELKDAEGKAGLLLRKVSETAKLHEQAPDRADCGTEKPAGPAFIIESYSDEDINKLFYIGKLVQKQSSGAFILISERDLKFAAFCKAEGFDMRAYLKTAFEKHGGRGGGSPSFFQGSFETREALDAFIKEAESLK